MNKKLFIYSFIIFPIIFFTQCSVWEDFTTYFNRWHNIKLLFNEVEKDIKSQKKNIFSTEPFILSGTSISNLTKVVDKCSDLLQFNRNSSLVDDAILILGKAFYYQQNYQKSKRKFEELIALSPSDEIKTTAELYIAKCQIKLRNFTDGLKLLNTVTEKAILNNYDEIVKDSFIEEINYFKSINQYSIAIKLLNRFINYISDDDDLLALVYFELGELYSIEKNYTLASESYLRALELTSDFDIEIKASIKYAVSLRLNNRLNESLEYLLDIRGKDKFTDFFPQIEIEIGKTFLELNKITDALDYFIKVDTSYKNSPQSAVANYEIGKLYEKYLNNYDSAAFYYKQAVLKNPPRENVDEINRKSNLFSTYLNHRKIINNYESQLFYAKNPDIYKQDSINYVQDSLKILKEYLEKKELADIWQNISQTNQKNISINYLSLRDTNFVKDSLKLADSLNKAFVNLEPDSLIKLLLVNAFKRDSIKIIDSLRAIGQFLLSDEINSFLAQRRATLVYPITQRTIPGNIQQQIPVDSLNFKKNPPKRPTIPLEDLENLIAKNKFELGNLFFTELEIPDSAYKLYNEIVNTLITTKYYPEALYAIGAYYLTLNQKQKADSIFQKIYDEFKNHSIVNNAAEKLGLPLIDLTFDPGKELYLNAEDNIKKKDYNTAINQFIKIHKEHLQSKYADKGLYAAGFILENDLRLPDSAVAVYDKLISNYPNSEFVKLIAMKVTIYKQEQYRIKTEKENSQNIEQSEDKSIVDSAFLSNKQEEKSFDEKEEDLTKKSEIHKKDQTTKTTKKNLESIWNPRKISR